MIVLRLHHYMIVIVVRVLFAFVRIDKCCELLVPSPPTQSETLRALPQELERFGKSQS